MAFFDNDEVSLEPTKQKRKEIKTISTKKNFISSFYTFSLTFSYDAGLITLKQTKNTSVCGYDKGLRRS